MSQPTSVKLLPIVKQDKIGFLETYAPSDPVTSTYLPERGKEESLVKKPVARSNPRFSFQTKELGTTARVVLYYNVWISFHNVLSSNYELLFTGKFDLPMNHFCNVFDV
ncbi:hypothetical protein DKX38_018169 [Salix brachista]|uniref:Uncharacterized protein n=1 Tax=Salix brachista TaxID=2182728 RepID=A0A5N5KMC0_9ROSI|nr:hypothetical protein DKX38_018169 [Salix brachista]